jgi:hypothetical protein
VNFAAFPTFKMPRFTARTLRHCHLRAALKTTRTPFHRLIAVIPPLAPITTITQIPSLRRAMSSDAAAEYEAFLKKAQKDYSAGYEPPADDTTTTTAKIQVVSDPHPAIRALGERFYVSEVDEVFEAISFAWEKESLPNIGTRPFLWLRHEITVAPILQKYMHLCIHTTVFAMYLVGSSPARGFEGFHDC